MGRRTSWDEGLEFRRQGGFGLQICGSELEVRTSRVKSRGFRK